MSNVSAQLQALGFSRFTVWYATPPFAPEENFVRVQRGPIWIDIFTAPNAVIVVPDYATITQTVVAPGKDESDLAALKSMPQLVALANMSPSQIDAYFDANVTNLASAVAMLKQITKAVSLAVRAILK